MTDEQTNGRDDARKAVEAAVASGRRVDRIVEETRRDLAWVRARGDRNHFRDTMTEILRGKL
jgi:hypothetical protein